jgi:hypothetical protein
MPAGNLIVKSESSIGILSNPSDGLESFQYAVWRSVWQVQNNKSVHFGVDCSMPGNSNFLPLLCKLQRLGVNVRFHKWEQISPLFFEGLEDFGYRYPSEPLVYLPSDSGISYLDLSVLEFVSSNPSATLLHPNSKTFQFEKSDSNQKFFKQKSLKERNQFNLFQIKRDFFDLVIQNVLQNDCFCLDEEVHERFKNEQIKPPFIFENCLG